MKKQITASVVAFALALAMPTAAFAAESIVAPESGIYGEGSAKVQDINTDGQLDSIDQVSVKGDVKDGVSVKPTGSVAEGVADVEAQYDAMLADKVANEDLTQAEADVKKAQWQVNATKYENLVDKYLKTDNATELDTFVMHGDVKDGAAVVTVKFDATQAKPGDKVTYVILHEDGSIQYATTKVGANGTIAIEMNGFSAFAFINTPAVAVTSEQWIAGVDGATNGTTVSADKNLTKVAAPEKGISPKTGC